jgi:3-dehydroquinate dehydratase/shikimate dehydrogenase
VHATPVRDEPPFAVDRIADDTAVVDLTYGPEETRLAAAVRARHQVVIDGYQVLEVEVDRQFRLLTGRSIPEPLEAFASSASSAPAGIPAASLPKELVR